MKKHNQIVSALIIIIIFIGTWVTLIDPVVANGQAKRGIVLSQESRRDPFLLPSGVYLLLKNDMVLGTKGIPSKTEPKGSDILSLKVNAILISDHIRLALIDRHIVTIGDSIHNEKVLEIKTDRVILGKGNEKRSLLLSQSPVLLNIEKRPSTSNLQRNETYSTGQAPLRREERKDGGRGE
jgi:hypothetical protein